MIKCCRWRPSDQIVIGVCDKQDPNCIPGYFITKEQLLEREIAAFEAARTVDFQDKTFEDWKLSDENAE